MLMAAASWLPRRMMFHQNEVWGPVQMVWSTRSVNPNKFILSVFSHQENLWTESCGCCRIKSHMINWNSWSHRWIDEFGLICCFRCSHPCRHRRAGGEHRQHLRGQHGEELHLHLILTGTVRTRFWRLKVIYLTSKWRDTIIKIYLKSYFSFFYCFKIFKNLLNSSVSPNLLKDSSAELRKLNMLLMK